MAAVSHVSSDGDILFVFVYGSEYPDSDYAKEQWIQRFHSLYHDDVGTMVRDLNKNKELAIPFMPNNYLDLANHLEKYFCYDLQQAREIIKWIDEYVASSTDLVFDIEWSSCYLEILEGASV